MDSLIPTVADMTAAATAAEVVDVRRVQAATTLSEQIRALQIQLNSLKAQNSAIWQENLRLHKENVALHDKVHHISTWSEFLAAVAERKERHRRDRNNNILQPD